MRRVPRESIPEDEEVQYNNNPNNNGGGGGRGTGIGRSYDFVPVEDGSTSASNAAPASSRLTNYQFTHKCEGCASGICRSRKLPISGIHDSTGDTVSTSGSVTTNSRIDDAEFRDMDEHFDDWEEDDGSVWVSIGANGKVLRS
jgi:hypothetical protein